MVFVRMAIMVITGISFYYLLDLPEVLVVYYLLDLSEVFFVYLIVFFGFFLLEEVTVISLCQAACHQCFVLWYHHNGQLRYHIFFLFHCLSLVSS